MQFPGLTEILFDHTLRTVTLGSAILGLVSGGLGSFAVLRKQSLVGDAISHVALPGIALAFLLTGSKDPIVLLLGAAIAGWVGTLVVMGIVRSTRIKGDTALGLVLSVFFGFGLVLLTFIQKRPDAAQAGLDRFLFGQAAAMLTRDVATIAVLGFVAALITALFWKEFKLLSFDPEFGASLGFAMRGVDVLLTTVIVLAVVIGLQTVGVVLMAAMIVAPGAAARQWTDRLGVMVLLAGFFGALAGVAGSLISASVAHLPTGPTIVVCLGGIAVVSLLAAPNRGLVWSWISHMRARRSLRASSLLLELYALSEQHRDRMHAHSSRVLEAIGHGRTATLRRLRELEERGLVVQQTRGMWALTEAGVAEAEELTAGQQP